MVLLSIVLVQFNWYVKMQKVALIVCLFFGWCAFGQDIHVSQPSIQGLYVSAANCAQLGTKMAQVSHRQQWVSAGAPYQTQLLGFQLCKSSLRSTEGFLATGLQLQRDFIAQRMSNNVAQIYLAYHLPFSKHSMGSAGISFGYGQRSFEPNGQWGSQYNGLYFDASILPSVALENRFSFGYLDAGIGFAYVYSRGIAREKTLSKLQMSFGAHHLNRPVFSFLDGNARLQPRLTFCSQAEFSLASLKSALEPVLFLQVQRPAKEILFGFAFHQYLKGGPFSRTDNIQRITFGLYNRLADALVTQFGIQIGLFSLSSVFDITISDFSKAPKFQSAFEIQMCYRLR